MIYQFGTYELDDARHEVRQCGQVLTIEPKVFQVLLYLIQHRDRVVSKSELLDNCWPETHVTEWALTRSLTKIRKAVEPDRDTLCVLNTIRGRGYIFVAPVQEVEATTVAPVNDIEVTTVAPVRVPTLSNLVGRESELERLQEGLERAQENDRQVIFVSGEPGIGKTTLVDEFLSRLPDQSSIWIGRGQCVEHYGEGEAYLPVFEAIDQLGKHVEIEPFVNFLSRYAPTWLAQMPKLLDEAGRADLKPQTPGTTQQRMLRELAEAIEVHTGRAASEHPPLFVLVFEDLQWSDVSTVDLISVLATRREPARLLVIGTDRPVDVFVRDHPLKHVKQELMRQGQCHDLVLHGLTLAAIADYLDYRFGPGAMSNPLVEFLHERTEGNPFFLVTLINEWVETGVLQEADGHWQLAQALEEVAATIPASVQHMIERQIDRLTSDEKLVLEAAGIAGAEFSTASVAAGLEQDIGWTESLCEDLSRRQLFLRNVGEVEWPDGTISTIYQFQHGLQQSVWYKRVTAARRRRFHLLIGQREELGYAEQSGEHATALAVHFELGGDALKALHYRWSAGTTALRRYAHHEASAHLTTSLTFLSAIADDEQRLEQELTLLMTLGPTLIATKGYAAPEVERAYARAQELCQQQGATPQQFKILMGLHAFYAMRGKFEMASQLADQGFELAQRIEEPTRLRQAHWALGLSHFYIGNLVESREYFQQVIATYHPSQHKAFILQDPGVTSLSYDGLALWVMGEADQAVRQNQKALDLAQKLAHPFSEAWSFSFAAMLYYLLREPAEVQRYTELGMQLCRQHEFAMYLAVNTMLHGWALTFQDQVDEGIAQIQDGFELYTATGASLSKPTYLYILAEGYQKRGEPEAALKLITDALELVEKTGERVQESELYRMKGELLLECLRQPVESEAHRLAQLMGNSARVVENAFREGLEVARSQGAKFMELRLVVSYSLLKDEQGERENARRMLSTCINKFSEGFDSRDLQVATNLLTSFGGPVET